jgi:hypothetical protein
MPNSCSAFGAFSRVLVKGGATPRSFASGAERIAILMESMQRIQPFQGRRRITGDLSQYAGAIRPHSYLASGALVIQAGAGDFARWLPRIMWGSASSPYDMGINADAHKFDILIDRENAIFRYTDCQIARCVIRSNTEGGQQPQNEELVEMILYIYAIEEEVDGTAFPVSVPPLVLDGQFSPYAHWEGVLDLNDNPTPFRNFELTIDNRLQPVWYSSLTPNCFRSAGRVVSMKTENPFTATTIDDALLALEDGVPANITFTHADGYSTEFDFAVVRNNYKTPTIGGRGEIPLELSLEAFRTDSAHELIVTNNTTATP